MATVNNYNINWDTNQVAITFDVPVTAINVSEWYLENQETTYNAMLSLSGSTYTISGSTATINMAQSVLNEVKNQTTSYRTPDDIGLSNGNVNASTPAQDAADTNHGAPDEFQAENTQPLLDAVIYAPATDDANGNVTSFTIRFNRPLTTDLPLTEIFGDNGTTQVALTTDSTYTKSTVDPRYVTIAVGSTDRTTFSSVFKNANGGISTASNPTGSDWNGNPLAAVAAGSPVLKTIQSGTNAVTAFNSISYGIGGSIVLTFAEDVIYFDPAGLTFTAGGLVTTLTGGTVTIDGDEVTIVMSDADLSDLQQNIVSSAGNAFMSDAVWLNSVGASVPTGYLTSPLLVGQVTIVDDSPNVVSFDYYSKDTSSSYDAILTFNIAGFTVADITLFRFQDVATGTPGNMTNLSTGSTLTRIDDYTYGLRLNSTDATAVNAWATADPNNVHFGFSAAGALSLFGNQSPATTSYLQAAVVYESISPEYEYMYNGIAVRSDNLAGELKLTSTSRYDAMTIKTAANTTVGGVLQFKDVPTQNVPGRVLKVASYDATDAANPVLTVDWEDAGVTRLIAGNNVELSAETGAVVVSAAGSTGGGVNASGDAGSANPTQTQLNDAFGTDPAPANGDTFYNTNAGDAMPLYLRAAGAWQRVATTTPA